VAYKAVFLDRDGTINYDRVGYVYRPDDLEFILGAIEGMRSLHDAGYRLVIASNQSGIAKGLYTESDYALFMRRMVSELAGSGVPISGVYCCPHHPEGSVEFYRRICRCRKPGTALLERASRDLGIGISSSWLVGDKWSDIKAGHDFGCRTVLVHTGCAGSDVGRKCPVDYECKDLKEASELIISD